MPRAIYLVLELPPGGYTVTVSAPGFATLEQRNVVLTVGAQSELPLTLSLGRSETVTVSAGADVIETQRSSQSTTVDQLKITNLPTNGRNYINFTLTNSQIARDAAPSVGAIPTSGLNFGGVRARSNSINVDGVDAGDYVSGGTRATVSQDAVQEFQIITNGFDAEYGRASGGVVNIITKSGTNATHASAFGFLRNRYIQATNPFSTVDQPAYTRVQAGFTVGGAIVPDRTFYFFSTEITRRQETGFSDIGADNFGLTSIDVSKFYSYPTGTLSVQGTPQQQAFLAAIPANTPNIQQYVALVGSSSALALTGQNPAFLQPTIGASNFVTSGQATPTSFTPLNALIGNFPVTEKTEIYSLRLDHKLTGNQQLMVRASVSPSYITGIEESAANQNLGENAFSRTATQDFHDVTIAGQYTTLLGQNKVNELRIQYLAASDRVRQYQLARRQRRGGEYSGVCVLRQDAVFGGRPDRGPEPAAGQLHVHARGAYGEDRHRPALHSDRHQAGAAVRRRGLYVCGAECDGCVVGAGGAAGVLADSGVWAGDSAVVRAGHRDDLAEVRPEDAGRVSAG